MIVDFAKAYYGMALITQSIRKYWQKIVNTSVYYMVDASLELYRIGTFPIQ